MSDDEHLLRAIYNDLHVQLVVARERKEAAERSVANLTRTEANLLLRVAAMERARKAQKSTK
jgi:hypothetical protein